MTLTKDKLMNIAKEMDLKGITKLTKTELIAFIINNPCVDLTKTDCEKMSREELRVVARKCNVLVSKKKQQQICDEILTKFKGKKKSIDDLQSKVSATKVKIPQISVTKVKTPQISATKVKTPQISATKVKTPQISATKIELPKAKKSDAQSFPILNEEVVIHTDLKPKEIIKNILEDHNTNFTDGIKINKLGKNTYTTRTCNIHVNALKPLSKNSGISGAGIFLGMMDAVNKQSPNVVLKLWKFDKMFNLTKQLSCLEAEWNIYTYIIPFMFFKNLTPCVLYPIESGECTKDELSKIMKTTLHTNDIAKFTITPYIQYSLVDIFNSEIYKHQLDVRNIMFQLIYTIAAFNKMGMRHNDCHTNNVRVVPCPTQPFKICFKLREINVYSLVPFLTVFNDFDRTSVGTPISDATKIKNPCTSPGGYYCNYIHQCDTLVGGARDLLIITFYMYDVMDKTLRDYVYRKILASTPNALNRLNKYIVFKKDGTINWTHTKHSQFLFTELNDALLVKLYPSVDLILNDKEFLHLCFESTTMKSAADNISEYKIYDFYNVNVIKEYPQFKNKFYVSQNK